MENKNDKNLKIINEFFNTHEQELNALQQSDSILKLKEFVKLKLKENKRIVVITSGGTTVPLEK